jgi:hypothetical protein
MVGTAVATRIAKPSLGDREIDAIVCALAEQGRMSREPLARSVGAASAAAARGLTPGYPAATAASSPAVVSRYS